MSIYLSREMYTIMCGYTIKIYYTPHMSNKKKYIYIFICLLGYLYTQTHTLNRCVLVPHPEFLNKFWRFCKSSLFLTLVFRFDLVPSCLQCFSHQDPINLHAVQRVSTGQHSEIIRRMEAFTTVLMPAPRDQRLWFVWSGPGPQHSLTFPPTVVRSSQG